MRTAVSVLLAGLLVTLPIKQVFAQAAQQEAVSIQQTPDSTTHLIRVPVLTPETALLWQPIAENRARIITEPSLSAIDPDDWWVGWAVLGVALLVVVILLWLCFRADEGRGCFSGLDG